MPRVGSNARQLSSGSHAQNVVSCAMVNHGKDAGSTRDRGVRRVVDVMLLVVASKLFAEY